MKLRKIPKFTTFQHPFRTWRKFRRTGALVQQIKQDLLQLGHSEKTVQNLLTSCSALRLLLLDIVVLIFRLFIYRFRSNLDSIPWDSNKSYLICMNHYSHQDSMLLLSELSRTDITPFFPVSFASTHLNKGLVGFIYRGSNVAFISRTEKNDSRLIRDLLRLLVKYKVTMILCPEGGWSCNGNLKRFKLGMLSMMPADADLEILPIKLQSSRTFGDLNFSRIRQTKTWNTSEGLTNIIQALPDLMKFKGFCYINCGPSLTLTENLSSSAEQIKKSIESLAVYSQFEQECLTVFRLLFSGKRKHDIPISQEFGEIFEWHRYTEKELQDILYFSCNQFIYRAIEEHKNLRLAYEDFIFRENMDLHETKDSFFDFQLRSMRDSFDL